MDYVLVVLTMVFHLGRSDAAAIMLRAHYTGAAYVMTLPYEEAKHRVGVAHSLARGAGYPLTFTIEPAT
jgi:ATP-dependent Clp protease adapter protein ClpS